jgi:hypothetical protein
LEFRCEVAAVKRLFTRVFTGEKGLTALANIPPDKGAAVQRTAEIAISNEFFNIQ